MMKRQGVTRLGATDDAATLGQQQPQISQPGASNLHALSQAPQPQILGATAMLSVSGSGFSRAPRPPTPVINYMKPTVQFAPQKQPQALTVPPRHKAVGGQAVDGAGDCVAPAAANQFQRLKVEDALSYLDQVKFKFNTQPQVYNDFLDIMKEFKSQTIDTPGVITRVSNLFKGHTELIVGFNTFLPPGYKIEVQSNGQVSVSMPSPTSMGASGVMLHHQPAQQPLVHLLPVPQAVNPGSGVAPAGPVSGVGGVPPASLVHNLSVGGPPPNTLHHISQAHQQIEAQQHHTQGVQNATHPQGALPNQPVEFNHAIEYVNKIKSRFSRQPEKYKRFLEILHAYQRGHREVKEPQAKQQTEQEVYSQVAKLFENQDDLLAEFGQFLPDAKAGGPAPRPHPHYTAAAPHSPVHHSTQRVSVEGEVERGFPAPPASPPHPPPLPPQPHHAQISKHSGPITSGIGSTQYPHHLKRSPSFSGNQMVASGPPTKKPRTSAPRDVSIAEAAKYATLQEYNFFDRVRHALRTQDVYNNFLKCLSVFNNEIVSSSELVTMTAPFLCRHPELQRWLQDFVGPPSPPHTPTATSHNAGYNSLYNQSGNNSILSYERDRTNDKSERVRYEPIGPLGAQLRHDRPQGDAAMDVDLSTCKRLGTSYCALPRGSGEAASRRCSGRTPLCREVLNDTWVSFPTWSEDSTFVTCRKTQYEEYIYRCEDERFELDVVIETNAATIRVLEGVQKKLARMTADDAAKYRLEDTLGGSSPTIHQRALRRIYGDKAVDIIAGLKKNPMIAVPVVLRRLKAKEEEWREAQKGFNKQWREQNEKYYLKSLDHQGINFKQNDLKALRSKSLFNEVESAYAARKPGPHLVVDYNMKNRQEAIKIVRDAAELLIHHARRQTAIQKAEKRRIKRLLRQFLPDLFNHPRQPLSDDERDDDDKDEPTSPDSPAQDENMSGDNSTTAGTTLKQEKEPSSESDNASDKSGRINKNNKENTPKNNNNRDSHSKEGSNVSESSGKRNSSDVKQEMEDDDCREARPNEARFVCTMSWYLFARLHGVLCQRLADARRAAMAIADQEARDTALRHPSVALALRLKPNKLPGEGVTPADYYPTLLELIRGVLDGNTEPSAYEDAAREMLGIRAYPAYTLDKIVSYAVRQLQHCVSEAWSRRASSLAARGMRAGGAAGAAYVRAARRYLRHHHTAFLITVYGGDECRVTYEMLEGAGEERASPTNDAPRLSPTHQNATTTGGSAGAAVSLVAAWSLYSERYAAGAGPTTTNSGRAPVFLVRCARRGGGGETPGPASATGPQNHARHHHHHRRKPHRTHAHLHMHLHHHDTNECTIAPTPTQRLRLLAARPHQLYRRGALLSARQSHPRLHAARRARLRAWLSKRTDANLPH